MVTPRRMCIPASFLRNSPIRCVFDCQKELVNRLDFFPDLIHNHHFFVRITFQWHTLVRLGKKITDIIAVDFEGGNFDSKFFVDTFEFCEEEFGSAWEDTFFNSVIYAFHCVCLAGAWLPISKDTDITTVNCRLDERGKLSKNTFLSGFWLKNAIQVISVKVIYFHLDR